MIQLDEAGRGLPWTEVRPPPIQLRSWVEHTWIARFPLATGPGTSWKIVPDPSPNLLIHDTGGRRRAWVVGPRTKAVDLSIRDRRWTAGIRLRPGTLPGLSGLPGQELTDRSATLQTVFGKAGRDLDQRIQEAKGPEDALELGKALLRQRAVTEYRIDWRVGIVLEAAPTMDGLRVGRIARGAGISRRALQSAFAHHVGLSPKETLSIRRLFKALHSGLRSGTGDWSRVAVDSGYHDGSHLTRDCRRLLGEPPTAWRARGHADSYNR